MHPRLRTLSAALGALVLLSATGCGSDDGPGGSGGGKLDMGIAVANISLNFAHEMVLGAESAADHAGDVNFKAVGPPNTDGPAEVQLFQNLTARAKDGIVLENLDPPIFTRPAARRRRGGSIPAYRGWVVGKSRWSAIGWWCTGAPHVSAVRTSAAIASSRPTPSPATITGRVAAPSRTAARSRPPPGVGLGGGVRAGTSTSVSSVEQVHGYGQEHGSGGRPYGECEGAAQREREVAGVLDVVGRLHGGRGEGDEVPGEHGVLLEVAAVLLAGHDDQRGA